MSVNKVILIGFIGEKPEVKQINQDFKVANFKLATSEKYTSKTGEKVENTEWHNCQASSRTADVVEKYVAKGDMLYIEGKIKTRSWENKEGVKQYTTYIQVDLVQLFPKKKELNYFENKQVVEKNPEIFNDDLPF